MSPNVFNRLDPLQHQHKNASIIFQQPKANTQQQKEAPQAPAQETQEKPHETVATIETVHPVEMEATRTAPPLQLPVTQKSEPLSLQIPDNAKKEAPSFGTISTKRSTLTKKSRENTQKLSQLFQAFSHNVQQDKVKAVAPSSSTYDFVMDEYKRKLMMFFTKAVCFKPNALYGSENIATVAEICITFNEKGLITKFEFKHQLPKHKLQTVEDTIKKLVYSSGLFPPIPRTLKPHDTYTFSLLIDIQIAEGIHKYSVINR